MSPRAKKTETKPAELQTEEKVELEIDIPPDPRYNELVKLINYDNSILSVSSSILKHYNCEARHKTNELLDKRLERNPRNIVLVLLDGMGAHSLKELLPPKAFLRQNMVDEISSVFPPTTVAATTSVLSGLSPVEHGRLGWYLYYEEIKDNVTVFTNIRQTTGKPASEENLADKYMPYKDIFTQIRENSNAKSYLISSFSEFKCRSSAQMFKEAKAICEDGNENFIYCYWYNPDTDMHEHGTRNWRVKKDMYILNSQVRRFCEEVKDTTVIVIADHGLVDIEWDSISEHPKINAMLRHKPTIERRAASLFVHEGLQEDFAKQFRKEFGDKFMLLTRREVLEGGMLGEGEKHKMIDEFLGDFLAVSTDKWSLDGQKGDSDMRASHAGLTKEEMTVPLIVVER